MKEHPWMLGIMEVVATLFLLTATWMHVRESQKLRLRPLYSQFVNLLILPLIRAIDEYWKRENIQRIFIKYHGLPPYKIGAYWERIHSAELERVILWNMFEQECPDVANIIIEHDEIITQLEQVRKELRNRLVGEQKLRDMVVKTLREHLLSHSIKPAQHILEGYLHDVIDCLILRRTNGVGIDHEREYWETYRDVLQETFEKLKMDNEKIGMLAKRFEDLKEKLTKLPDKSTIIMNLNRLVRKYAKKYGVQLQRPEWLL